MAKKEIVRDSLGLGDVKRAFEPDMKITKVQLLRAVVLSLGKRATPEAVKDKCSLLGVKVTSAEIRTTKLAIKFFETIKRQQKRS